MSYLRRPILSPPRYDDWKSRDDDYSEYDAAKAEAAQAYFRMYLAQQLNQHLAEHPEERDAYTERERQWGKGGRR